METLIEMFMYSILGSIFRLIGAGLRYFFMRVILRQYCRRDGYMNFLNFHLRIRIVTKFSRIAPGMEIIAKPIANRTIHPFIEGSPLRKLKAAIMKLTPIVNRYAAMPNR